MCKVVSHNAERLYEDRVSFLFFYKCVVFKERQTLFFDCPHFIMINLLSSDQLISFEKDYNYIIFVGSSYIYHLTQ